ncbi:54S ribosomal protein img2, mitochondrial [Elasticomyces elasticus]|nr:54S ribosomal protein img2, mitochondrial [Elasticomyces elasticus]
MSTMSSAPSIALLRSLAQPPRSLCSSCQRRAASTSKFPNFIPKHKYAAVSRLDKLHRQQKADNMKEKLESRSKALVLEKTLKQQAEFVSEDASQLPYHISRTKTMNLPIYETTKAGGSKHITTVRKINDIIVDKQGRKKEPVAINRLTQQLIVKGWHGPEIKKWAETVGF